MRESRVQGERQVEKEQTAVIHTCQVEPMRESRVHGREAGGEGALQSFTPVK